MLKELNEIAQEIEEAYETFNAIFEAAEEAFDKAYQAKRKLEGQIVKTQGQFQIIKNKLQRLTAGIQAAEMETRKESDTPT